MKIAVLSDLSEQTESICDTLSAVGHACHAFKKGKELIGQLHRDSIDMLIIDWHISDESAAEALGWARDNLPPNLPVLLLANRAAEDGILFALVAGASDYLVHPVRHGELKMRVQILLRRAYPAQTALEQIQFGQYIFEKPTGRLMLAGRPVGLTQKEFELALLFFRNLGRPLSRAYIQEAVWAQDAELPTRTMDTHVSRVRTKLRLRPENGFRLTPVYSYGYQLEQLTK